MTIVKDMLLIGATKICNSFIASKPMIVVWDDHEITNDTWKNGAQNHSPDEGSFFYDRKNNAIKAYYEWMPIRDKKGKRKTILMEKI